MDKRKRDMMAARENLRKCPFCAEEIKIDAIYCRWCHKDIEKPAATNSRWENLYDGEYKWRTSSEEEAFPAQSKEKSFRFWVTSGAVVVALAFVGFVSLSSPSGLSTSSGSSSETNATSVSSLCRQVKLYSDNISEAFSEYDRSSQNVNAIDELVSSLRSLTSRIDSYRNSIPESSSYDNPYKADRLHSVLLTYANSTSYLADAIELGETSTQRTWIDSINEGNSTYDVQCVLTE